MLSYFKTLLFIIFFVSSSLFSKELKPLTIQLSWFDQFQFAGYYIAKEKGFYEQMGLDVTIKPFEFGIDISKEVSIGNIDFAVGRETLLLQRSEEKKIVALYALFQASPLVLLSTQESNINNIDDFIGKRIMTTIEDASEVSLRSMINSNNIKINKLNFIKHTHNINDLINKKTDLISAYLSKSPYELNKKGIKYNIFDPKIYGFDMYSDFLYTSQKLIKQDSKIVSDFKKASLKGWKYAYSNIDEAADLIIKKYNSSKLSKEALIFEANELKKLSYFKTNKLGEIKKEKVQRIYDLYNVMGLVKHKLNINDFIYYDRKIENLKFTLKENEYLTNKKELKICVLNDFMPYSDIQNGKFIGAISDFTNLLEKKLNINIIPISTNSITESLEYLKDKKCNVIPSLSYDKKKESILNFSKSYNRLKYVIVTTNKVPFISDIKILRNKKIAVIKDHPILNILNNKYRNIDFIEVKNSNEGLLKVKNNDIFAFIGEGSITSYKVNQKFINELKISGKIDEITNTHMGIEKDDISLLNILNKFIINIDEEIKSNILNKWLYIQYKKDFDYNIIFKGLAVLILILLAVLYRQKLLNKMNKSLVIKVEEKTKELKEINDDLEKKIKEAVDENLKKDRTLSQQSKMAAIGEMMESIAYQWRSPLTSITKDLSDIKTKKELGILEDKFLTDTLDSIVNSATNLSITIDDFKDFFKPTKEKTNISLSECCNKTLDLLNKKIKNKKIKIIKNFESITIESYESEIIQVLMSIINNSNDAFSNTVNHERLIFIDILINEENILIKIRDNAGGVRRNIINKIYEPYFTTKVRSESTGIGLFMCEEIITKHMNGKIESVNKKYIYNDIEYKGLETLITLYSENYKQE